LLGVGLVSGRRIPQRLHLIAIAVLLCASTQASAQAGQLDPTFAKGGIFSTTTSRSTANALAIQNDGKTVIAGTGFANNNVADTLIRLNTNGTLDPTFGCGGVDNFVPTNVYAVFGFFAVAIQPDGKIVAAAATGAGLVVHVALVDTNGSLDPSFGNESFTAIVVLPTGLLGNLALQPDGAIVVAAT
jgi:uncharacterized delta-60 repeat protein